MSLSVFLIAATSGLALTTSAAPAQPVQTTSEKHLHAAPAKPKVEMHDSGYTSPGWRSDPGLRGRLAALNSFENYAVRPPRGYTEQVQTRGPETFFYWSGQPRANGVTPEFIVATIVELPSNPLDNQTIYNQEVAKTKRLYPDVIFSPMETGVLNGLPFLKTYYKGNDSSAFMHHGVVYMMVDGSEVYTVTGDDTDPNSSVTIPIMEAAARTFQKAPLSN
jgi:hypothetical protein